MARRVLVVVPILAVTVAALVLAPVEFAAAQQRGFFGQPSAPPAPSPMGGFFNFLFGPLQTQQPRPVPQQPTRPRAAVPAPQQPQASAAPAVAKDATARTVVVVGDFVATVVAAGLDQAFADEPKIRIVDRSNSDSGLARQDYYDWGRALSTILANERPDIVVIMLGANDRQTLSGTPAVPWGTPEWDSAYGTRVSAMAASLAAFAAPFLWVSTVPMRSTPEPDMAHVNDLTGPRVMAAGGLFVDVWDGFIDDSGRLVLSGPDVNGQTVQLRTQNGINFTAAGQEKLAFYVAKEIRRVSGIGSGGVAPDLVAGLGQGSHFEIAPDGSRRLVGPVISLTDPPPVPAALAGDPKAADTSPLLAAPKDGSSPQALLIKGAALPVIRGRADDFTWPRH